MKNYQDLQDTLDKVVGSIGLNNTIHLLGCFIGHLEKETDKPSRQQAINSFIIHRVAKEFDIDHNNMAESELTEYVNARTICYYLLYHYSGLSYRLIGEKFGNKPGHSVKYFVGKCADLISLPKANRLFYHRFTVVEQDLIHFLSQLT